MMVKRHQKIVHLEYCRFFLSYFGTIASDRVVLVPSIPSPSLYRIVGLSLVYLVVLLSRVFVCARDDLMMLPSVTVHDFALL
jgi:hypothetical protein